MVRYLFNGAKLPNWMKLIVLLAVVGALFLSQRLAVNSLSDVQRETAVAQIVELRRAVRTLRSDIEDNSVEDSIRTSKVMKRVARVEARINEMDENGTEGGNARIEQLSRLIKHYR